MKHLRIASLLLATVLLFSACKKDKDEETVNNLTGTWTISQVGGDLNNNNQVETNELVGAALVGFSGSFTFNANNSFTATLTDQGQTENAAGTYAYSNNQIRTTTTSSAGTSTDTLFVKSITNTNLTVGTQNTAGGEWFVLTK